MHTIDVRFCKVKMIAQKNYTGRKFMENLQLER